MHKRYILLQPTNHIDTVFSIDMLYYTILGQSYD